MLSRRVDSAGQIVLGHSGSWASVRVRSRAGSEEHGASVRRGPVAVDIWAKLTDTCANSIVAGNDRCPGSKVAST